MKKSAFTILLFAMVFTTNAQISYTIPEVIPEFDGTYEDFGQNHFFYPNEGEIRNADEEQSSAWHDVKYYTKFQYPEKYLLNNTNLSFVFYRTDSVSGSPLDSLHRIDLKMDGRRGGAYLAEVDTQKTVVLNYFTQHFGSGGRTDVRGRASIVVEDLYTNIDMVYCSNNFGTKIFYVVWPGGNPSDIVLHFDGAKSTGIVGSELVVKSNWDAIKFVRPKFYQYTLVGNLITPVNVCPANWTSVSTDKYGIATSSSWNSALPLIIQVSQGAERTPATGGLAWSTYFGGSIYDYIYKSRVDANKNLIVAGISKSPDFPISAGPMVVSTMIGSTPTGFTTANGFVAKFNPLGVLLWVTSVGGSNAEWIQDFDIKGGDFYCVGPTNSSNIPTQTKTNAFNDNSHAGNNDGFVFQLGANGQTNQWLTYFGGSGFDEFKACKVDTAGAFFIVGTSNTPNLTPSGPVGSYTANYIATQTATRYDAIILKFNATTDTLNWFTYYGTSTTHINFGNSNDAFRALDINGTDVYVGGEAGGTNLPNSINNKFQTDYFDGILVKFNTSGGFISAKYTDGNAVNRSVKVYKNKVYTVGEAHFGMSLVHSPQYYFYGICTLFDDNACFTVHNLAIDTTFHCTYLGDNGHDEAVDLQFDSSYDVFYISGATAAPFYPTTSLGGMYFDNVYHGYYDYFITAFNLNDTNIVWSTYLGSGSGYETNGNGEAASLALDGLGSIYLCGATNSYTDFPLATNVNNPYFQNFGATDTIQSTFNATITKFNLSELNIWVGVNDFPNTSFAFGLYPNPTSKFIVIENRELVNQNLRYAIYDVQGRKLRDGNLNTTEEKNIDVSCLPSGVYIINVSNGTRTFSNKFVKTE